MGCQEKMRMMKGPWRLIVSFCSLLAFLPLQGEPPPMLPERTILPDAVGAWRAAGPPKVIDAETIFDYMDGGGELYLAYRFDSLQVWEYRDGSGNDIVVELYRMKGSDDAFGLLSLDWGGEAVSWGAAAGGAMAGAAVPPARALYGQGLLRLWSDGLYARVMAVRETPAARSAVLKLGEAIVAGRPQPPPPALLRLLPVSLAPHWALKPERTAFFRSHLVLNSLYYLSHENILGLGTDCEAALAAYEGEGKRCFLLVVQYPDNARAAAGLGGFIQAYIGEGKQGAAGAALGQTGFFQVEDGWLGFKAGGPRLALAFACPDLQSAQGIVHQVGLDR
jgi:hypothetical protein